MGESFVIKINDSLFEIGEIEDGIQFFCFCRKKDNDYSGIYIDINEIINSRGEKPHEI